MRLQPCIPVPPRLASKAPVFGQVSPGAPFGENREGGEIPPRAQRCKDDARRIMPLVKAGKARRVGESKSEDRPGDR